jgi:hypothetical protein
MSATKEKKRLRNAKLRYFCAGMISYIVSYVVCVLLMKFVMMLIPFPIYVEMVLLVAFFAAAAWLSREIVHRRIVMQWVTHD